ncbi:mannonate dehydratase [Spirosoma pulveris]
MENSRRHFLKNSASVAALSLAGQQPDIPAQSGTLPLAYVKDAGMQFCLAHFYGMDKRRIELSKQLQVMNAVGGINARPLGITDAQPWEYKAIMAVKDAWTKEGLTFKVVEGPPALYEKTKLGLSGRDEEIDNFIQFVRNLTHAPQPCADHGWGQQRPPRL